MKINTNLFENNLIYKIKTYFSEKKSYLTLFVEVKLF